MYRGFYYGDIISVLLVVIPLILSLWASFNIKRTFAKYAKVKTARHITGDMAARAVLNNSGVTGVGIDQIPGNLSDNFNPRDNTIHLSQSVYGVDSIASVGVAAHEAGHAVQHAEEYAPMKWRSTLVPVANIGSSVGFYIAILGIFMSFRTLAYIGIALFAGFVLFELVTLPVELNASRRAVVALRQTNALSDEEMKGAEKVLRAAALTYLVALASAIANLLRLVLMSKRRN